MECPECGGDIRLIAFITAVGQTAGRSRLTSDAGANGRATRGLYRVIDTPSGDLGGTAVAISRAIIAILENHQRSDGSVKIPAPLVPWMGKSVITT
jgi:hypothetical protein